MLMSLLAMVVGVFTSCSDDDGETEIVSYSYGIKSSSGAYVSSEMQRFEAALQAEFGTTDNKIYLKNGQKESDLIKSFNKVANEFVPATTLNVNANFCYALYRVTASVSGGDLKEIAVSPTYTYTK